MKYFLVITFCILLPTYYTVNDVEGIIVSPCKVRNLVAQPEFGTSLKHKGLTRIIQIPPVFVQNVMVGICENQNQNVSTGKVGEFYSCQQRYSIVEVYTAESSSSTTDAYHQTPSLDNINDIKFVRESVIIESGCDFTFNLLPLIASAQNPPERPTNYATPQQKVFLKSPYHPVYRQPPRASVPVPAPQPSQGIPVDTSEGAWNPYYHMLASGSGPVVYDNSPAIQTQGRAEVDTLDLDDPSNTEE